MRSLNAEESPTAHHAGSDWSLGPPGPYLHLLWMLSPAITSLFLAISPMSPPGALVLVPAPFMSCSACQEPLLAPFYLILQHAWTKALHWPRLFWPLRSPDASSSWCTKLRAFLLQEALPDYPLKGSRLSRVVSDVSAPPCRTPSLLKHGGTAGLSRCPRSPGCAPSSWEAPSSCSEIDDLRHQLCFDLPGT